MDRARWEKVIELYHAATEHEPARRNAFLANACGGDDELRSEVESLLRQDLSKGDMLERIVEDNRNWSPAAKLDSHPMTLSVGTRLAHYEILGLLGAGGMGEVYRARDTKLDRQVAIKILPEDLMHDRERLARFEREAKVLASLNHPHIAQIYALEENALIMELVDGKPLKGPLPVETALRYSKQIADALGAAHEKRIVHRDLKPANIMITQAGDVKVLDFGLAAVMTDSDSSGQPAGPSSPTVSPSHTGVILGTPVYMAPEQARGEKVDKRADVWAFGCLWYEMLTGEQLFKGDSDSDILAAVLRDEPSLEAVPRSLRPALEKCLRKDPSRRWRDIGDVQTTLEEAQIAPASSQPADDFARLKATPSRVWPWIATASLVAVAVAVAVAAWFLKPIPQQAPLTFEVAAPEGNTFRAQVTRFAISPDGRHAAYVFRKEGQFQLGIRKLDSGAVTPLAGTEGGDGPFWSPDSRWIAFFAKGKLWKIAIDGGRPQVICDAIQGFGTWNQDDVILFSDPPKTIQRVSASGGTPVAFFPFDKSRNENGQTSPRFLPDGKHFLYSSRTSGEERGIAWASLDGKERRFLFQNRNSPGSYAVNPAGGSGWIIYVTIDPPGSGGRLLAQGFDPVKAELKGEPALIADSVEAGPSWSTSNTGMISFPYTSQTRRQFTWIRRDGTRLSVLGETGNIFAPSIAPDEKTIAFGRREVQGTDLWLFDPARNTASRFTFDSGYNSLWTPDGSRIIYTSLRQRLPYLIERSVNGADPETILKKFDNTDGRIVTAITRDGRWLSYGEGGGGDSHALFISRPEGKIVPFPEPRIDPNSALISPDGQWVVYSTIASSSSEVFVQSSPKDVGGIANVVKSQISRAGGKIPRWRADGKEIFYISPDGMMMSAPVESGPGMFRVGAAPTALFEVGNNPAVLSYDVTSDGQRFLLTTVVRETLDTPITIIVNWPQLLQK